MIPANSSYTPKNEGAHISSSTVVWAGPDLDCIGLCKGDTITDTQAKIAEKVCEILKALDLSDLDLDCVTDCPTCPQPDKSLLTVLRLMIKAFCTLKSKVDNMSGGSSESSVLNVNLRCLAITDGSGNVLNNGSDEEIVQSIIDQVCSNKFDVALLKAQIASLQDIVNNIDLNPTPPAINVNSSCLFNGSREISIAHTMLDAAFCQLRAATGTPSDLSTGISKQPTLTGTQLAEYLIDGFIQDPANVGQSLNNIWVILTDVLNKVIEIQNTCCKVGCDAIKVGFEVEVNESGDRIILHYTEVMGTSIPAAWEDIGSVLTITDENDRERKYSSIDVTQNGESPELDISGLSGQMNMCLEVKLRNTTTNETCIKCVCRDFAITDTSCPVCRVDVSGTTGSVTIVYQDF